LENASDSARIDGTRLQTGRTILEIQDVSKDFGALKALHRVSLTVETGEIVGIAGPNGSGKSTLFNVITAVPFNADEGTITFEGRPITRLRGDQIARRGVARIFQRETEFSSLSVFENVLVAAIYGAGMHRNAARDSARSALEFLEFAQSEYDRPAAEVTVYAKKRLMIASALAMKPRLLLLDEPASGLTKPEVDQVGALVTRLNAAGMTILLIEHVLSLLLAVSNRIVVLNQGEELASGLPEDVIKDQRVVEAYLGTAR
jgi:branched-chain amino acid transport system ATP-binding protein